MVLKSTNIISYAQKKAVSQMSNGCILCGGVGTGKSRTSLYYFMKQQNEDYVKDLYIITTAMKRDSREWEQEMTLFALNTDISLCHWKNKVVVDSWNNIKKYTNVVNAFFIFDEDKVTGYGTWAKSFLKISRSNNWVVLSATPGDCWMDYVTIFIANGFYKNKTEFARDHIIYSRFAKFPKVDRYINTGRLIRLRNKILVDIESIRPTVSHHEDIYVDYDILSYKKIMRYRWDIWKEEPIQDAAGLCYALRRIVNSDTSRLLKVLELCEQHPRAIIFYNFDYELDLLKSQYYGPNCEMAEWNGHKHQPIPTSDNWVYFVQYTAGCEGWNCIKTDTVIFYSQNYSYKVMTQASGRIDRLNTPYKDLYYYHIKSRSGIDLAISKALSIKKNFNEGKFVK